MTASVPIKNSWIGNPAADLVFFGFGWIVVLFPLLIFKEYLGLIILVVLLFTYVHRHYTLALVYGDREEFEKRKQLYIVLPVMAALITVIFVYANALAILLAASVLWTMYHSVAQKYGITRVYSRKAGYGAEWIEKGLIFSWFFYLFFAMAEKEADTIAQYDAGQVLLGYLGDHVRAMTLISYALLAVAVGFTLLFAYQEFENRHRLSMAKNFYVVSTLMLYLLFFYSLLVGYVVFAFSHALEYMAFVLIFVRAKYRKERGGSPSPLAVASKKIWLSSSIFSVGIVVLCLLWRGFDQQAFNTYIIGSSFLHFIYDGLIWKVRQPEVGRPFGIVYAKA